MPKSRASFVKRQREMAKKEQRQAKLQRRLERKAGVGVEPPPEDGAEVADGADGAPATPDDAPPPEAP
jgi:hypothetical protein